MRFLRRIWSRYSKLGRGRKKKQVWRKPTGRDNPMRQKRRGYPAVVSVGYKTDKKEISKVKGKIPMDVRNLKDLGKVGKNNIIILRNIGKKKKIEVVSKVKEKGLEIANLNINKFLKRNKIKEKKK